MAVLIKADGTKVLNVEPANGKTFMLKELQEFVGGYIEIISIESPEAKGGRYEIMMVLNEEGKLKHLPINDEATKLARPYIQDYDVIVGDVLVCQRSKLD